MKSVSISEAKNHLSAYIDLVRKGLVKRAGKRGPSALLKKAPQKLPRGASALYARDPRPAASRAIADGFRRLEDAAQRWNEITASASVRETALALLRRHPLRATDALQLAAAKVARQDRSAGWEFVSADKVLLQAAIKEGFEVLAP